MLILKRWDKMKDWQEFDDYMIYNETEKRVIHWTSYGDDKKYFLSKEYTYENDFLEPCGDDYILINEEVTENNSMESLIKRTKEMI